MHLSRPFSRPPLKGDRAVVLLALPRAVSIAAASEQEREWSSITVPRIERYARRLGATFSVVRSFDTVPVAAAVRAAWSLNLSGDALKATRRSFGRSSGDMPPVGRGNATVYVLKFLAVADALRRYRRVLLIDDSAFVTPNASSIFDVCPADADVCGFSEGVSPVDTMQMTWLHSKRHVINLRQPARPAMYFNTGVILFGQGALGALLRPRQLAAGLRAGLFAGGCPEQEYLCAQLSSLNSTVRVHRLAREFNYMPTLRKLRVHRDGAALPHTLFRPPRELPECAPSGDDRCQLRLVDPLIEKARATAAPRDKVHIFHLTGLASSAYLGARREGLFEQLDRTLPRDPG